MNTFLDSCKNWVCSMLDTVRIPAEDWALPPPVLKYYYVCSRYMMSLCDEVVLLEGRFLQYINLMSVSEVIAIIVLLFNVYDIVRSSRRCVDSDTRYQPRPQGAEVSTMTDMKYHELESMVSQYLIQLGAERSKNRMLSRQLQILKGVRREKMEMDKLKKYVILRGGNSELLDGWSVKRGRGRKVYYCDLKGKCWKTLKDAGDVLNLSPLYKTRSSL